MKQLASFQGTDRACHLLLFGLLAASAQYCFGWCGLRGKTRVAGFLHSRTGQLLKVVFEHG